MPEADRSWKVLLVGSWFLIAGVGLVLLGVVVGAAINAILQGGSVFDHLDFGQFLQVLSFGFVGFTLRSQARAARTRAQSRAKLFTGDSSALPLARISVDSAAAPGNADLPLVYSWRGVGTLPRRSIFIMMIILLLPLIIFGTVESALIFTDAPLTPNEYLLITLVGGLVVALVTVAGLLLWVTRARKSVRGSVIATVDALVQNSTGHPASSIRWQDARLLEVMTPTSSQKFARMFVLQSASASVAWYITQQSSGDDSSTCSFEQQQKLLNLVVARTGLQPRTLSPELQERPLILVSGTKPAPKRFAWRGYAVFAALILFLLGLAAAVLLVPLTGILWLDTIVALSFVLPALNVIVFLMGRIFPQHTPSPLQEVTLPFAPPLAGSTVLHINGVSPFRRLVNGFMTVLYVVDLAALGMGYVSATGLSTDRHALHLSDPMNIFLTGVAIVALFGFVITLRTFLARAVRVSADAEGLRSLTRAQVTSISWSEIDRVETTQDDTSDRHYKVISRDGQAISWYNDDERRFTPMPSAFCVTANELAAIVVQRSGEQLTLATD